MALAVARSKAGAVAQAGPIPRRVFGSYSQHLANRGGVRTLLPGYGDCLAWVGLLKSGAGVACKQDMRIAQMRQAHICRGIESTLFKMVLS